MRFHRLVVVVVVSLAILELSTRATGGTIVQAGTDGRATKTDDPDSTYQQQQQSLQEKQQQQQQRHRKQEKSNMKQTEEEYPPMLSIANVIERAPVLQKFHAALVKTNVVELISGDGPFTVLIPWNKAIIDADDDWIQKLFSASNGDDDDGSWMLHLRELLLFHIHFGSIPLVVNNDDENNAYAKKMIVMANGQELQMQRNRKQRIHFTTDQRTQQQSSKSMTSQIGYHQARNGFGYMMETIFMPPSLLRTLDTAIAEEEETSFFYSLLEKAQLTHLFRYDECDDDDDGGQSCVVQYSNFTVFAPTNKAFAKVKREHVEFLQSPEGSEALRDVLLYHIVPNHVFASVNNLPTHQRPARAEDDDTSINIHTKLEPMLDGQTVVVVVNKQEDAIHVKRVNKARVSNYALAKNGIIQILDTVLIPPARPPKTTASSDEQAATTHNAAPADTCSVSDTETEAMLRRPAPTPVAASVATSMPIPVQTKTPAIPAKVVLQASSAPTPVPAITPRRPRPAPSEVWSLPSPTIIDIVNVPLVREGRKIKIILP